ncbi:MAG: YcxB family protein [Bacteroidetes bacterium]|nr:YcxB family protein [Bacteroidota bacterium]
MHIEYTLNEQDYLDFQLYTASKSIRLQKKKLRGWILLPLFSILLATYFYIQNTPGLAIYFGAIAFLAVLFYPKYFNWRHARHYKRFINANYKDRMGLKEKLEITPGYIFSKNITGEGKINITEIDQVTETSTCFFIKIASGSSFIVPKRELENLNQFKSRLKECKLSITEELEWKWA